MTHFPRGLRYLPVLVVVAFFLLSGSWKQVTNEGILTGGNQISLLIGLAVAVSAASLFVFASRTQPVRLWASPRVNFALGLIGVLAFLLVVIFGWHFDLDDKWINYRISKNVLETGLPLWNARESINVNTGFLYNYILAPGHLWFGGGEYPFEVWSKLVGVVSVLVLMGYAFVIVRGPLLSGLVVVSIGAYVPFGFWSLGGLETAFGTTLLVIFVVSAVRFSSHAVAWSFLLGGLMWVRPEYVLVGIFVVLGLSLVHRRHRPLISVVVPVAFALPIVAFLLVNKYFFGSWLPQTFYVKGWNSQFSGSRDYAYRLWTGAGELSSALTLAIILLLLVGVSVALTRHRASARRSEKPLPPQVVVLIFAAIGTLAFLAYAVLGGYQHMGYTFRYYLPGIILIMILVPLGLNQAVRLDGLLTRGAVLFLVITQLAVSFSSFILIRYVEVTPTLVMRDKFSVDSLASYISKWREAGRYFQDVPEEDDRVFLLQGMLVGAFSDAYLIDQYYMPAQLSSDQDLANCATVPNECNGLYDYFITFGPDYPGGILPQTNLETEGNPWEVVFENETISILENKTRG